MTTESVRDIGMLIIRLGFGFGFAWFHGLPKFRAGAEGWARNGEAMRNLGINSFCGAFLCWAGTL